MVKVGFYVHTVFCSGYTSALHDNGYLFFKENDDYILHAF
jgi:hypothetical protein